MSDNESFPERFQRLADEQKDKDFNENDNKAVAGIVFAIILALVLLIGLVIFL